MPITEKSDEPFDRLTRLTEEMTKHLETEENADVKGIVMLSDNESGGIKMWGYNDANEGIADLFMHIHSLFAAQGKQFAVLTDQGIIRLGEEVPDDAGGRGAGAEKDS